MLVKILGTSTTLGTGSNVGNATVVRLYNAHGSAVTITRKLGDTTIGSLIVSSGEVIYLEKDPSDTLLTNLEGNDINNVKVTKIAYGN